MASTTHTPGPWTPTNKEHGTWKTDVRSGSDGSGRRVASTFVVNAPDKKRGESIADYRVRYDRQAALNEANARLIAAAPELLEALHEGRRAIGDHFAPNDCYATGPLTGDPIRDLVQCPACSFIAMHDAAIAKATGGAA